MKIRMAKFWKALKVSKSRKQFMVKWILQKNERWISALEDYYFKVSTKETLSSCKKNIDSRFVLTFQGRNSNIHFFGDSILP